LGDGHLRVGGTAHCRRVAMARSPM
jgi:hypothetical protein